MNYKYTCTFTDEQGEEKSINFVGPIVFQLRYDDKPLLSFSEFVYNGEEETQLDYLLKNINTKCSNFNFYITLTIDDIEKTYLIKSYDSVNYLIYTFSLSRRDNEVGEDTYSHFPFIKTLEVR